MTGAQDDEARRQAENVMNAVSPSSATNGLPDQSKIFRIAAPGVDVATVATALAHWYEQKRMKVQLLQTSGVHTVQTRTAAWRRAVGMAVALTVVLHREGRDLVVEMGAAPWIERAGVAAIGTQVPLLLGTAAWGAWEQARLPDQSVRYIRSLLPALGVDGTPSTAATGRAEPTELGRRAMNAWRKRTAQLRDAVGAPNAVPSAAPPAASPAAPSPARPDADAHAPVLLDVNTATSADLTALPGVDADTAAAILHARNARGAFASRDEFERSTGLKPHVVARLRGLVVVRSVASPTPPPADRGTGSRRRVVDL